MDDLISRAEALLAVKYCTNPYKAIKDLPGVGWIPVTEEMPQAYTDVLVCTQRGDVYRCYWCEDGDCFAHARDKSDVYGVVTHWMPLPEPPKEVE